MFQSPIGMGMITIVADHPDGQTMIVINRALPRHRRTHGNVVFLGQP